MDSVRTKERPHRISKACENCRSRKLKCSGGSVCKGCAKYDEQCVYRKLYRQLKKVETPAEIQLYVPDTGYLYLTNISNVYADEKRIEIPEYLSLRLKNDNSSTEFFGPASNFSFVNQLNHFLRQLEGSNLQDEDDDGKGLERFGIKPMDLRTSSASSTFSLASITTEKMNELLIAYLETWNVPCPLFKAEELFDLSAQTWKNESAPEEDSALLYLVLSIGSSASYLDMKDSNHSTLHFARGFFDLALETVPLVFTMLSFEAVRLLYLMSLSACNLGDTALSYVYSGAAVRTLIAIGLHKNTPVLKKMHTFDEGHHRRTWVSTWQWEKYWSFCVGRPSCSREDLVTPTVLEDAFTCTGYGEQNRFQMNAEHMRLRVFFGQSCLKIHLELYNSKSDLLTTLSTVEKLSKDIDDAYFASSEEHLVSSDIGEHCKSMSINSCREWFWIRIYYLYLKLMIFRPFLIFYAYLNKTSTDASSSVKERLKAGSDICVAVAIELSHFIVQLNRQVRMIQPILFICTYLESASTVLLFYIVSSLATIPDALAEKIWDVLQDTRLFLNGSSGPYAGTIQIIANDALKSLQNVLLSKRTSGEHKTVFDKFMQPVIITTPKVGPMDGSNVDKEPSSTEDLAANMELFETALEDFWLQTLDWISYA